MTRSYFTNLQDITIQNLKTAKHSIVIAVAWINFNVYFQLLSEILNRGVSVKIIINNDQNNNKYIGMINLLEDKGALIRPINAFGIMHHKFCVIDESRCLFGSFNWTVSAETKNIEDLNICDEPIVIFEYLKEFNSIWELAKSDIRLLRNPPRCDRCGAPLLNILIVEQEGYDQTKIQIMRYCDCGGQILHTHYYDISVYNNYQGIIENYQHELEECNSYENPNELEYLNAKVDYEISKYWSSVRENRMNTEIIYAVGRPGIKMYGRHDEEKVFDIVWRERGTEELIPKSIPRE